MQELYEQVDAQERAARFVQVEEEDGEPVVEQQDIADATLKYVQDLISQRKEQQQEEEPEEVADGSTEVNDLTPVDDEAEQEDDDEPEPSIDRRQYFKNLSESEKKRFAGEYLRNELQEEEQAIALDFGEDFTPKFEQEVLEYADDKELDQANFDFATDRGYTKDSFAASTAAQTALKDIMRGAPKDNADRLAVVESLVKDAGRAQSLMRRTFDDRYYELYAEAFAKKLRTAYDGNAQEDRLQENVLYDVGKTSESILDPAFLSAFLSAAKKEAGNLQRRIDGPQKDPEADGKAIVSANNVIGQNIKDIDIYESADGVRAIRLADGTYKVEPVKEVGGKLVPKIGKNGRNTDFLPVTKSARDDIPDTPVYRVDVPDAAKAAGVTVEVLARRFDEEPEKEFLVPGSTTGRGVIGRDKVGYYLRRRQKDEPARDTMARAGDLRIDRSFPDSFADISGNTTLVNANDPQIKYEVPTINLRDTATQKQSYGKLVEFLVKTAQNIASKANDKSVTARLINDLKADTRKQQMAIAPIDVEMLSDYVIGNTTRRAIEDDPAPVIGEQRMLLRDAEFVAEQRELDREKSQAAALADKVAGDTSLDLRNVLRKYVRELRTNPPKTRLLARAGERVEPDLDPVDEPVFDEASELAEDYVRTFIGAIDDSTLANPEDTRAAVDEYRGEYFDVLVDEAERLLKDEEQRILQRDPASFVDKRMPDEVSLEDLMSAADDVMQVATLPDSQGELTSDVQQSMEDIVPEVQQAAISDAIEKNKAKIEDLRAALADDFAELKKKFDSRLSTNPMFDPELVRLASSIAAKALDLGVRKFQVFVLTTADAMGIDATVRMGPLLETVWTRLGVRFPNFELDEAYATQEVLEDLGVIGEKMTDIAEVRSEQIDFIDGWSRELEGVRRQDPDKAEYRFVGTDLKNVFIDQSEADEIIASWDREIARQRQTGENSDKTVISLFDYTGVWAQPWMDAGYNVVQLIDLQHGIDVLDIAADPNEWFDQNAYIPNWDDIHMVLAACPCTEFAASGARWWGSPEKAAKLPDAVDLVNATMMLIDWLDPRMFAIENPIGRIAKVTDVPTARLGFDPHHFGNPYTKRTLLHGNFLTNLPTANVFPKEGSKMHKMYGGKSEATKRARSVTPDGFAKSFFMANSFMTMDDTQRIRQEFRAVQGVIDEILDKGLTAEQITAAVQTFEKEQNESVSDMLLEAADGGNPQYAKRVTSLLDNLQKQAGQVDKALNSPYRKQQKREMKDLFKVKKEGKSKRKVLITETGKSFEKQKKLLQDALQKAKHGDRLERVVNGVRGYEDIREIEAALDSVPGVINYFIGSPIADYNEVYRRFTTFPDGRASRVGTNALMLLHDMGYLKIDTIPTGEIGFYDPVGVLRQQLEEKGVSEAKIKKAEQKYREIVVKRVEERTTTGPVIDLYANFIMDATYWNMDSADPSPMTLDEIDTYNDENNYTPLKERWTEKRYGNTAAQSIEQSTKNYVDEMVAEAKIDNEEEKPAFSVTQMANRIIDVFQQDNRDLTEQELVEAKDAIDAVRDAIKEVEATEDADKPLPSDYESIDDFTYSLLEYLEENSESFRNALDELNDIVHGEKTIASKENTRELVAEGVKDSTRKKQDKPKKKTGLRKRADDAAKEAEAAAQAWKNKVRNIAKGNTPTMGVDMTLVIEAVDVAVLKIKAGVLTFSAFVEDMASGNLEEMTLFGPYLTEAWKVLSELSDEDKAALEIPDVDTDMTETWSDVVARMSEQGVDKSDDVQDADLEQNIAFIEQSETGRALPGSAWFASGMQGNVNDLRRMSMNWRAVGLSAFRYSAKEVSEVGLLEDAISNQIRRVSDSVLDAAVKHVNKFKLPLFIDSGMVSLSKGLMTITDQIAAQESDTSILNRERIFERVQDKFFNPLYQQFVLDLVDRITPSQRSLLHIVGPDVLVRDADGSIKPSVDATLDQQSSMREFVNELTSKGVNVLMPVHRDPEDASYSLQAAVASMTDAIDMNPNVVLAIPYNHAAWTLEELREFVEFEQRSGGLPRPLKLHLLGGGAKRLKKAYDVLSAIMPTISMTGDSTTETVNRGRYDTFGERKNIGLNEKVDIDRALFEWFTSNVKYPVSYEAIYAMMDMYYANTGQQETDQSNAERNRRIDEAVRFAANYLRTAFNDDRATFADRLRALFLNQPNQRFDSDGTADVFNNPAYSSEADIVRSIYIAITKTGEKNRDESERQEDDTRRSERARAEDTSDETDGDLDGGEQQTDGAEVAEEQDPVGVREDDAEGSRRRGDEVDETGDEPERGSTDSERVVGDGSRPARGRHGAPESTRPNYHLTEDRWESIVGGSKKVKFARNQAAIQIAHEIRDGERIPSDEDLDTLAGYTGWGAFGPELFQGEWESPQPKDDWSDEDAWLRTHLTESEWKSMQKSIINAHYTAPDVVKAVWDAVAKLGFKGGRVLEPSMGSGNFFGIMPREMMAKSQLTGVELDETTALIASILYPNSTVRNKGYEDLETADNFYDLVISNVPFGTDKPAQVIYDYDHLIHNFFFRRALDHVKPGGLVAFITSTGTADGSKGAGKLRRQIQNEGQIVGMVRLPSGMFKKYADTSVTTDLIIVRKNREDGRNPDPTVQWWSDEGQNNVVPMDVKDVKTGEKQSVKVNKHWIENPKDVIGKIAYGATTRYGAGMMVQDLGSDAANMDALRAWIDRLPENVFRTDAAQWMGVETEVEDGLRQNTIVVNKKKKAFWRKMLGTKAKPVLRKDGTRDYEDIALEGPEIGIVSGENIVPLQQVAPWASAATKDPKKLQAKLDELVALAEVRDAYDALLKEQSRGTKEKIALYRARLNETYDAFVDKYGTIDKSEALKVFKKANDPLAYAVEVLAYPSSETGEYIKRGVFREGTVVEGIKELKNATLGDAFAAERNRSRTLDYGRIAKSANLSEADAISQLVEGKFVYKNEVGEYEPADTFLSGNVRKKYRALEAAIDEGVEGLEDSLEAVSAVIPPTVPYNLIDLKLGPHFVPAKFYREFVAQILGIDVDKVPMRLRAGKWITKLTPEINNSEAALTHGVDYKPNGTNAAIPFSRFLFEAMNNGQIKIYDPEVKSGGITIRPRQLNEKETAKANLKLQQFRQKWETWAWADPARADELQDLYNEEYNSFVTPNFENVPLSFVGIVTERDGEPFALRKHQREAIWRGLVMGKGIFAHEVGTGKTLTMAGLAMESRRFGYAKKPMLFAHNINSRQVADEIREAYPAARVLYVDNMTAEAREKTMALIAAEDWDLVVVPHSLTDRFSLKKDTIEELVKDELRDLREAIIDAFNADENAMKGTLPEDLDNVSKDDMKNLRSRSAKELVRERNKIIDEIKKAAKLNRSSTIFFEDMGIDMVMVDEAHVYKKIPIASAQVLKGLNKKGSKRGSMLRLITNYVRGANNGRGIYTFTGTPVTNTLNEIFNQMRYVMAEEMQASKVGHWDSWFSLFAESVMEPEISTGGTWEPTERLRAFNNLPELRQMIGQYLDIVKASDIEEFVERPSREGFVPEGESPIGVPYMQTVNVTVPPTDYQKLYSKALRYRYEAQKAAKGRELKGLREIKGDPYSQLLIQNEGISMSLDPRLTDYQFNPEFGMEEIDRKDPNLKINKMIDQAMPIYNSSNKATQMIFMQQGFESTAPRSTGEKDENDKPITVTVKKFNLAEEIKRRLIEEGVKESEIVIFSKLKKPEDKKIAAKKMQQGLIRFAIGSTESMGVGVNAQNYMAALHHLDCPWMPGDLEQRNGRARRQGNRYNTVMQFRYITENDQDARRWQVALIKDAMINMFMDFSFNARSFDMSEIDMDDEGGSGSDLDQSLATATGDPRIILRNKLANELERLLLREKAYNKNVDDILRNAEQRQKAINKDEQRITAYKKMQEIAEANKKQKLEDYELEVMFGRLKGKKYSGTRKVMGTGEKALRLYNADTALELSREQSEEIRALAKQLEVGQSAYIEYARIRGLSIGITYSKQLSATATGFKEIYPLDMQANLIDDPSIAIPVNYSLQSFHSRVNGLGREIEYTKEKISGAYKIIENAASAKSQPFPKADRLKSVRASLLQVSKELQENPEVSPAWFRYNAPPGSLVYLEGERYQVQAHRGIDVVIAVDADDNVVELPAKPLLDEVNGSPLYPELQDDFDGDIEGYAKAEAQKTVKEYKKGTALKIDIGSFSTMFTEEALAKMGFDVAQPQTYTITGQVAEDTPVGSETMLIEVDDALSAKEMEAEDDKADTPKFVLEIRPEMNVQHAMDVITSEPNPVLDAMLSVYRLNEIAGVIVPDSATGKAKKKEQRDEPEVPTMNETTISFDDFLFSVLQNMTIEDAYAFDRLGGLEQSDWVDRKLGGQLYQYQTPMGEGKQNIAPELVDRDAEDVDALIETFENRVAKLLGRDIRSNFNPPNKNRQATQQGVPFRTPTSDRTAKLDIDRSRKLGDPAKADPISAEEIIEKVGKLWDLPIRRGMVQGALGFYRHLTHLIAEEDRIPSPRIVRMSRREANNLAVLAHEVAHDIDQVTQTSAEGYPDHIKDALMGMDYRPNRKDRATAVSEGFAEFMRAYLTLSRATKNQIADYDVVAKWFERVWAKKNKDAYKKVQQTRNLMKRYANQSVYERLQSTVQTAVSETLYEKTRRMARDLADGTERAAKFDDFVNNYMSSGYQAAKDMYHPLKQLRKFVRNYEIKANRKRKKSGEQTLDSYYAENISAYELATATHNTAAANAEQAYQQGVFFVTQDPNSTRPVIQGTDQLPNALAAIKNKKELQQAEVFLVAEHIVAMEMMPGNAKDWPMNLNEAQDYLSSVYKDTEKYQRFRDLQKALVNFNNGLLAMLYDAGVLTREDYERMLKAYSVSPKDLDGSLYLPMLRVTDTNKKVYSGSSHVNFGSAVKRRSKTGSRRPVVSPIASTFQRAIQFYRVANSVQIQQALLSELEQAEGTAKFIERITPMNVVDQRIPLRRVVDQMVEHGIIEADWGEAIQNADKIVTEDKKQTGGKGRYRAVMSGHADRQILDDFMNYMQRTYGLPITSAYKDSDVKAMLDLVPTGNSLLLTYQQDFVGPTKRDGNKVLMLRNGEPNLVELDPKMLKALDNAAQYNPNAITRAAGKLSRGFKWGAVGINTTFGFRQVPMDYITNFFQSREQGIERLYAPLMYSAGFALSALAGRNRDVSRNRTRSLFRQYGGEIIHELTPNEKGVGKIISESLGDRKRLGLKSFVRTPAKFLKLLQDLIAFSDVGPRYAEFVASLRNSGYKVNAVTGKITQNGVKVTPSRDELLRAINAARDVTYNFNRQGTFIRTAENFLPFTNAKMEGLDKAGRTLANFAHVGKSIITGNMKELERGDVRQAVGTGTGSIFMIGIGFLYILSKIDDEEFEEEEFFQRGRGFSFGGEGGVQGVFIPNSREYAAFQAIGEYAGMKYAEAQGEESLRAVSGKEERLRYRLSDDLKDYLEPVTAEQRMLHQVLAGTIGDPKTGFGILDSGPFGATMQFAINLDLFRDKPIVPTWMMDQKIPEREQYNAYTSETAKAIGKVTGRIGISPLEVEFLLNSFTGGSANRQIRTAERIFVEGDISDLRNAPGVSGIYTNRHQRRSVNDLYRMSDFLQAAAMEEEKGITEGSFTQEHVEFQDEVDRARTLIVELSKLGRDVDDAERVEFGRLQVGLAREALGRSEQESNVSPWKLEKSQLPAAAVKENERGESFWTLLKKTATTQLKNKTVSEVTKDFYANGLTGEQELQRRKDQAAYAEKWLKKYADSPAVKEATFEYGQQKAKSSSRKKGFKRNINY